ncbi:alcohol dehydrogenase catalytic domain-containing protein [Actinomadura madurae]|uniref:zinc-dependent alcohol dehydrogenase n=1 Tax=Actinomadura madurae TaxID=1993 RepID=UPI00399C024E
MLAGVWRGGGVLAAEPDWPEPVIGEDSVLVDVAYCGFCGSDAHIVSGRLTAGAPPRVLGHEVSGVVAAVGARVSDLAVGDRVAANLFAECGSCDHCKLGQPQFCLRRHVGAAGFARRASYRPGQLFRLPETVSLRHGALLEPVATVLHAVEQSAIRAGEAVLVLGAGPLGLLAVQVARLLGAGFVAVSEPVPGKQVTAARFADQVLDVSGATLREAMTSGGAAPFDVIVDFSGSAAAIGDAVGALAPRGRLVVAGVPREDATIPVRPFDLYNRELTLTGSYTTSHTARRALNVLGRLDLDSLITTIVPLEDVAAALRLHGTGDALKILVAPNGTEGRSPWP